MAASSGIPAHRYRDARRPEAKPYEYKDAISGTVRTTTFLGGVGLFVSAIQNTLTKQNVTAWGVFTRFGGTTVNFGMDYRLGPTAKIQAAQG